MKFLFTIPALFTIHLLTAQNIAVQEEKIKEEKIELVELTVSSNPPDAKVYIDSVLKGNTPYMKKLKPGKYAYRVEKALYETESGVAEITGNEPNKKKEVSVTLQPDASRRFVVKSFQKLEKDLDARTNFPVKDQNGVLCALIKVVTTERGFNWDGDQFGIMKTLPKEGEIWLYVPFGAKRITISHPSLGILRGYSYPSQIEKATVYEMKLGKAVWLTVSSAPPDAEVYINNVSRGKAPYTEKMEPGQYTYRVEKDLYQTESGTAEITGDEPNGKKEVSVTLRSAFGDLQITTEPENGASVFIDDIELPEKTPCKSQKLKNGPHQVTCRLTMYHSASMEVMVEGGKTVDKTINLKPNYSLITITSEPSADIYIDKKKTGEGKYYKGRISPGFHTIEAKSTQSKSDKKEIETVVDGKEITIHLAPRLVTGEVNITSNPARASVYIDNAPKGTTPLKLKKVPIGAHELSLKKTGFETVIKNIEVEDRKTTEVNEALPKKVRSNIDQNRLAENQPAYREETNASDEEAVRKRAEGDTLRSKRRRQGFRAFDILFGNFFALGEMSALKIRLPRIEFNTVEGVNVAYRPSYFKRWVRGDALDGGKTGRLEISPDFRYAHAEKKFTGFLKIEYKTKTGSLTLTGGKYIQQFNSNEPISPLVNTFYTLFQGRNYMKILERNFIDLSAQKTLKSKFTVRASGSLAKRHKLSNKIRYTYPPKNGNRLTSNVPVNLSRASASFSDHVAFTGRLGLEIKPWQKSDADNGHEPANNSPHALSLNYTKGINRVLGSGVNYDLLEAGLRFEIAKELGFVFSAGKFLNTKSMYFMDYKHFAGNRTAVVTSDPFTSFRLLDYYKYSTNDKYFFANVHYKFSLIGNSENLFVSYLSAPYSGNFTEAGYSLNILRLFRLEFVVLFQNGLYADQSEYGGFRLGVSSRLADHFSDK